MEWYLIIPRGRRAKVPRRAGADLVSTDCCLGTAVLVDPVPRCILTARTHRQVGSGAVTLTSGIHVRRRRERAGQP